MCDVINYEINKSFTIQLHQKQIEMQINLQVLFEQDQIE